MKIEIDRVQEREKEIDRCTESDKERMEQRQSTPGKSCDLLPALTTGSCLHLLPFQYRKRLHSSCGGIRLRCLQYLLMELSLIFFIVVRLKLTKTHSSVPNLSLSNPRIAYWINSVTIFISLKLFSFRTYFHSQPFNKLA